MNMNRRTMLKATGGIALGVIPSFPSVEAESHKPVAYIVTADSRVTSNGHEQVNRAWHVFWAKHPELQKKLDPYKYRYYKNVTITPYYDIKDFPWPALHPLTLWTPKSEKSLIHDYNEYHCFRTYDVDCSGKIKIIYGSDGKIA